VRTSWFLVVTIVSAGACAKQAARAPAFDRKAIDRIAGDPGALRGAIDWSRGLLLMDYYDGGGHQSFAHLCGKELEARLPELSRVLAADRAVWDDYEMSCADTPSPPECCFNPLETGAMDLTAQDRFIAAKLAEGRATRCP
jgi:hypothetical protein